ncbi:hypothetical protein ACFY9N_01185 [Microbacterium sp. NPDC008134]|uniref:hypothetical protein n=1 Tax=Microbacterium sp. NPDC008134 TaxID=3364183 RepID=UPI0036E1872F
MADVELLAVAKITRMIARCPHLAAQIASNDKTPFTDGHIDVYDGLGRSKEAWRGRVTVQVKGRTAKGTLRTFSISRTDLLAFQNDSGVLYFVVAIHPTTLRETAYYAVLSPFGIEGLLSNADSSHVNVPVPLTRLPHSPDRIEPILALALKTRKQNAAMGFDPTLFEQMQTLTVHSATSLDFDSPMTLDPGQLDVALEMTTAAGMSVPLSGRLQIFPPEYTRRVSTMPITCGGITFDEYPVRRLDATTAELTFPGGLTMRLRSDTSGQSSSFTLTLKGSFADQLRAIEFFSSLKRSRIIEIGGRESTYEMEDTADDDSLNKQLQFMRRLDVLFSRLDVDTTLIDFDLVSNTQLRELMNFYRSLIEGEEPINTAGETSRFVAAVGQWHLMFLLVPGSAEGRWKLLDPFDPSAPHVYRYADEDDPGENHVPVTVYDTVEDEYLDTVLNLRLDAIVSAYEALADQPRTTQLANLRVVALLSAADRSAPRRDALLEAAAALNDWLIEQGDDLERHHLNRYQILWRTNSLTAADRRSIREMKRRLTRHGDDQSLEFEVACALLLGETEEADHLAQQLSTERRTVIEGWPIWRLRDLGNENMPSF